MNRQPMTRQEIEARTVELFEGGLHCAEAVLAALQEGQGGAGIPTRAASAFGGGVGRSKKGLCGALSGGLIALGLAQGRDAGDQSWDAVAAKADALRAWFAGEYGCTRCEAVLEKLGPQQGMDKCIRLSGHTAGMFHEALHTPAGLEKATACGCATRQTKACTSPEPAAASACCGK